MADIVFVVDSSGSIRQNRYEQVLQYIMNVTSRLEIGSDRVRVGLITYGDTAQIRFHLNSYSSREDVLQAIEMTPFSRGRTNTAEALGLLHETMYTQQNGDRFDAPNFAIVVTDGESNVNPRDTIPQAIQARISGIHIFAVTVQDRVGLEIKGIASNPDSYNIFNVVNFNGLPTLMERLVDGLCDGKLAAAKKNPKQNNNNNNSVQSLNSLFT